MSFYATTKSLPVAHPMALVPKCGMPETPATAPMDPSAATSLDQSTESHLETLHRAAIGPINADYYLPLLARFETYDRASPSWNWAACVTTLNWMVFRGMWMPALLYGTAVTGAALGVQAAITLAAPTTASLQWSLWAALATLALLIPGFFGNVWLHGVYRKRLEKALTATPNLKQASMLLARWASSRQRLVAIAVVNLVLAGLIVTWLWPSDLQMGMWPRVSGEVQDMVPPPSQAASAPVAALDSASSPQSPPEALATASTQAGPPPGEPPVGPSTPAPGQTGLVAATVGTAASDAASAQVSTESAIAAGPAASTTVPATSAPMPTVDAAASAGKAAEPAPVASTSAAPAPALSVTTGIVASAPQPMIGASDAQPRQPTDPLLQPPGPSAGATAAQNAAIAAHARAARTRPARAAIAKPQPQPQSEPQAQARQPAVVTSKVAPPTGRYLINVGLFAQQDNARRAHARLEKAGLPAMSDTLQTGNGERTRVRVGPFTTQARANAAAERVRNLQLDAIVVRR